MYKVQEGKKHFALNVHCSCVYRWSLITWMNYIISATYYPDSND